MNRRELLQGSAALTAAVVAGFAQAADKMQMNHDHMHHHHEAVASYAELVHSSVHCVMFGEACVAHCLTLLAQGEKEMAACAQSVEQVLAICNALRQLATQNSTFVPRVAAVAMDICKRCEEECRKHEKKHKECHDCAEACAACYNECKKVAV